jgi:CubicO group peptidase (beta-lactamase class C family)
MEHFAVAALFLVQVADAQEGVPTFEAMLDHVIPRELERGRVPGAAVAVVRDGKLVFARGYGLADLETKAPVVAETTRFRIGSVSKVCTTLALTCAVEDGLVGYEDPVAPLLGGLALDNPYDEPVRVRHLLTHTAGFDQIGTGRQVGRPEERPGLAEFLRGQLRVLQPPGTVSCYDTYGITLAGLLLERLHERPFAELLEQRLFAPLGMKSTSLESSGAALARGYGLSGDSHVLQPYEWYVTLPASSVDSTVTDMARLMLALLGDGSLDGTAATRILAPATLARIHAAQYRDHPAVPGFTHGFWELERYGPEHPALQHGGTMRGYSCDLTLFPRDRLGVFVACNRDGETGPWVNLHLAVVDAVFEVAFGEIPTGGPAAPLAPVDTRPFEGTYTSTLYCHTCEPGEGWSATPFRVRAVAAGVLEFHGRQWVALEPLVFQAKGGGAKAAFRADEEGRITFLFTPNASFERLE